MSALDHVSRVRRLYKLIFRVHRALPPELRIMGDNYARDEFKRHKKCNPEEAKIFLNEWTVCDLDYKLKSQFIFNVCYTKLKTEFCHYQ